jgi:CBS domain-containing protein
MAEKNPILNYKIRDVMHRGVVTCGVFDNAEKIARIMVDNQVSVLVVTDERFNACGIISKTNLMNLYGEDLSETIAEDIMSSNLLTISPDSTVESAIIIMKKHQVHQLVIIIHTCAQKRPAGIFTSGDVISLMAGKPGPLSEAQIRCSDCLRKQFSIPADTA